MSTLRVNASFSAEEEREFRRLKAEYAAFNAARRVPHAALFARMRLLLKQDRTELRNARCMGFIRENAEKARPSASGP